MLVNSDFQIKTNQLFYSFFFALSLKTDTLQFKETFRHVLNFKHINTPNEVVLLTIQKSHN